MKSPCYFPAQVPNLTKPNLWARGLQKEAVLRSMIDSQWVSNWHILALTVDQWYPEWHQLEGLGGWSLEEHPKLSENMATSLQYCDLESHILSLCYVWRFPAFVLILASVLIMHRGILRYWQSREWWNPRGEIQANTSNTKSISALNMTYLQRNC